MIVKTTKVGATETESSISEAEFEELKQQARQLDKEEPRIARARFNAHKGRLELELKGSALAGTELSLVVRQLAQLQDAPDELLSEFIVTRSGTSIRWPQLNFGISTVALVEIICGLRHLSLATHQSKAGSVKTQAKTLASRANGAKGGRPRKQVTPTFGL